MTKLTILSLALVGALVFAAGAEAGLLRGCSDLDPTCGDGILGSYGGNYGVLPPVPEGPGQGHGGQEADFYTQLTLTNTVPAEGNTEEPPFLPPPPASADEWLAAASAARKLSNSCNTCDSGWNPNVGCTKSGGACIRCCHYFSGVCNAYCG